MPQSLLTLCPGASQHDALWLWKSENQEALRQAVGAGSDIDELDLEGCTYLHRCATQVFGTSQTISFLLELGANPFHTNRLGKDLLAIMKNNKAESDKLALIESARAKFNQGGG